MDNVVQMGKAPCEISIALRALAKQIDAGEVVAESVVVCISGDEDGSNYAVFGVASPAEAIGLCFITAIQLGLTCVPDEEEEDEE